jgi:polyhydroxyalkanoate synthesis repressor PhaR
MATSRNSQPGSSQPGGGQTSTDEPKVSARNEALRLIKKYPNRRLYDTRTSAYITLVDIKELVLKQEEFQVLDAKTGDDLTRSILLQIILEEENGGTPMFTSDVLSQFIRFYGNAMQGMMGNYLERNVALFNELQKRLQDQSQALYGNNAKVSTDLWNQFMNFQGPAMQGLISAYMDQSRSVFMKMQEQLQNQTRNMFSGFGFPGFPGQTAPGQPGAGQGTSGQPAQGQPQQGSDATPPEGDKKP